MYHRTSQRCNCIIFVDSADFLQEVPRAGESSNLGGVNRSPQEFLMLPSIRMPGGEQREIPAHPRFLLWPSRTNKRCSKRHAGFLEQRSSPLPPPVSWYTSCSIFQAGSAQLGPSVVDQRLSGSTSPPGSTIGSQDRTEPPSSSQSQ